jgi:hypothetical protein
MIGERFGKLVVGSLWEERKHGQKVYVCLCDCGTLTKVLGANLRKGNSTSCGCSRRSKSSIRMSILNHRHGETETKLWRTWKGVVERTTVTGSAHYDRYGGRGIGLHPDWLVYEAFAKYMGQPPSNQHSIDRIDNNKGYEPGNVRWATMKEQAANKRTNVRVVVNGETMILADAARALNISKSSASRWLAQGKLKAIDAQ